MKIGGNVGGDAAEGNIDKSKTGTHETSVGPKPPKVLNIVAGIGSIVLAIAGVVWYLFGDELLDRIAPPPAEVREQNSTENVLE